MKHSGILFSIIAFPFLLLFWGCPENGVTPPSRPLELTLEDVTCTEAVIKISVAANERPKKILLKRDGTVIYSSTVDSSEVIIREMDLLPKKTYTYTLWREVPREGVEAVQSLHVTTLDTTSHTFTWQIDTLDGIIVGIWGKSSDDMWAVGRFRYWKGYETNVAHYDGMKWKYQYGFVNDTINWIQGGEISSISGIDKENIWVAGYGWTTTWPAHKDSVWGFVGYWNGRIWENKSPDAPEVRFFTVFALDKNNVWAAGTEGSIFYFNGTSWVRQSSGTELPIYSISGTNTHDLYAVAENFSFSTTVLLHYNGMIWEKVDLSNTGLYALQSLSAFSPYSLWLGGYCGVGRFNGARWDNYGGLGTTVAFRCVKGNAPNNVYAGGFFGVMAHFNGVTWDVNKERFPTQRYFNVIDIAVFNDRACFAGMGGNEFQGRGMIITAKR